MALTRPSLEARTVAAAALAILVVALPVLLAIEAVKGDDLTGEESSIWVLGALAVVVAFVIGGVIAGARRPETAVGHSVVAAAVAFIVLVVVAIVRRLVDGTGLPAAVGATFVLLGVVCLSMGVLGGYLAMRVRAHQADRRRSRPGRAASEQSRPGRPAGERRPPDRAGNSGGYRP
jgi:predicted permease